MKSKPWIAVNVLTNEVLGNYAKDTEAYAAWMGEPIMVLYSPSTREVK